MFYYLFGRFGAKITFNRFVLRAYITLNCRTQVSSENYWYEILHQENRTRGKKFYVVHR